MAAFSMKQIINNVHYVQPLSDKFSSLSAVIVDSLVLTYYQA